MTNEEASAYFFKFRHSHPMCDREAELFYADSIAVVKSICGHLDKIKKPYGIFHECPELCEKVNKMDDRAKRIEASKNAVSVFFDAYQIRQGIVGGSATDDLNTYIACYVDYCLSKIPEERFLFMVTVTSSLDVVYACVRSYIKIIAYNGGAS